MVKARSTTYNQISGLNKALRALTPAAAVRMREASQGLADEIADRAVMLALQGGSQGPLVAQAIKAKRDRIPVVQMGSAKKLPSINRKRIGKRQTLAEVVPGWNFGSNKYKQFPPVMKGGDRALYASLKGRGREIRARYSDALLDALKDI